MTVALPEHGAGGSVATGEELADLLSVQHADLVDAWSRVSQLHACAREDVFLHARRRLALHLALERVVLGPRLDPGASAGPGESPLAAEPGEDVVAAEGAALEEGTESPGFDAASARVADLLRDHVAAQDRLVLTGPLPDPDRRAVEVALALWDGAGDAYLGNTWSEMVEVARDQLAPLG
jgi:hypothetical protein